jgi:hypothetical protein
VDRDGGMAMEAIERGGVWGAYIVAGWFHLVQPGSNRLAHLGLC